MKLAASLPAHMPSVDTLKMEDRKRPALDDDGRTAPPLKKQAVSMNGGSHPDADMPWKDDIESYQKDAILRSMREYQREVKIAKEELEKVRKQARYHDDHLRTIDSWFAQLIQEVSLVCNELPPADKESPFTPFESSLFTVKSDKFDQHLRQKSDQIKQAISQIFSHHSASPNPDTAQFQQRISQLLALEKKHTVELQDLQDQTSSLEERLEDASERYMRAERRIDRVKSQQVQKLEAQAKQPPKSDPDDGGPAIKREDSAQVNGVPVESSAEAEAARKEAVASRDKTKEHLDKLVQENNTLRDDLTKAKSKYATLSDEEYSHTELYKTLKSQHEDIIKRANDLQSIIAQLRLELKQIQGDRSKYKDEVDKEQESAIRESESQVTRLGLDLARIRNERDNALQELAVAKAERTDSAESAARNAELLAAKDDRITSLEAGIERHEAAAEGRHPSDDEDISALDEETVRTRLKQAKAENKMIMSELGPMENSYKKAKDAASQKLSRTVELEEQVARAVAEKEKANQKYFQTEKSKAAQLVELRSLRAQQAKTTEIVTQSKESENQRRALVSQLEKQVADLKDQLAAVEKNHRDLQQREYDFKTKSERFAKQVEELQKQLTAKDEESKKSLQTSRQSEIELAECKVQLEHAKKDAETWRKRGMGAKNDEYEMLKQIATCNICRKNFKEVALTKCGHVFCAPCIDERYNNRARKCPNCSAPFGQNDRIKVTL